MWGFIFAFKTLFFLQILSYLAILNGGNFLKIENYEKIEKQYIFYLKDGGKIKIPEERVEAIIEDEISKEEIKNPFPLLSLKPYKDFPQIEVPYGEILAKLSKEYDVNPLLLYCIMDVESGGNPYAISKKGAKGLMQLMPSTAKRFGVKNTFDPKENIEGAVKYLKYLDELFDENLELVLSGYICGENCVKKFGKVPDYKEVKDYLSKIFKRYEEILKTKIN